MGFTALDGLPMGTRPGQLDPGIVLYLMSEKGMSAEGDRALPLQRVRPQGPLRHQQRRPRSAREPGPGAKLALDHFVYRIALGGRDARGGHGRHRRFRVHGRHRRECASTFAKLSPSASPGSGSSSIPLRTPRAARCISRAGSRVACYVIPTDEELMIARHTLHVLRAQGASMSQGEDGMIELSTPTAAQGQEGARHRHRQRSIDRLGLRQGFSCLRRRPRHHLSQ